MSAKRYRPTGQRLLVVPTPAPEKTSGGIHLPGQWAQPTGQATVVATGGMVTDLKPGDTVFYAWIDGREVEHDGRMMRLLHQNEILAVSENP